MEKSKLPEVSQSRAVIRWKGEMEVLLTKQKPFHSLMVAYSELLKLPVIAQALPKDHLDKTPLRVVKALSELLSGYYQNPEEILKTGFSKGTYNEMITTEDIDFVSLCAHHILPFFGQVHFAYIPGRTIVGLSKIPRMVDALAKRLQFQEDLAEQIVDIFQKVVKPKGCAVVIRASHMCCGIRGVKKVNVRMRTAALRGIFLSDPSVKEEFLASVNRR